MKFLSHILSFLLLTMTVVQAQSDPHQQKPKAASNPHGEMTMASPGGMTPRQMKEYLNSLIPGKHHEFLSKFVGDWKTITRIWMTGPDSLPTESSGTTAVKWVLGDRFVQFESQGQLMGQPMDEIMLIGYDNYRNLYTASFASSMGTALLAMTGQRHPKTGNITLYGEMDEPMLSVTGRTVKYIYSFPDDNTIKLELIDLHAGDDYKVVEVEYTRVTAGE
jgi:Protein of unknown function (DUF1579)